MIRSADTDAQMNEENKQEHHEDILSVFNFLNNDPLFKVYSQELFSAFKKNKLAED